MQMTSSIPGLLVPEHPTTRQRLLGELRALAAVAWKEWLYL